MAKMLTECTWRYPISECKGEFKRTHVEIRMSYNKNPDWNYPRGYRVSVTPIRVSSEGNGISSTMFSSDCCGFGCTVSKIERNSKSAYEEAKKAVDINTESFLQKIEQAYGFVINRNAKTVKEA